VDSEALADRLDSEFEGSEQVLRAVTRQARDLADSGRVEEGLGYELTVDAVVSNLDDAPDGYTLLERWNWWIDSLELADGNYQRFRVRPGIESG